MGRNFGNTPIRMTTTIPTRKNSVDPRALNSCLPDITAGASGGFTAPLARRFWYSGSSWRFFPRHATDRAPISTARNVDGIVIASRWGSEIFRLATSPNIATVAAEIGDATAPWKPAMTLIERG